MFCSKRFAKVHARGELSMPCPRNKQILQEPGCFQAYSLCTAEEVPEAMIDELITLRVDLTFHCAAAFHRRVVQPFEEFIP